MVLPALLVGLAKAVEVILKNGMILDTLINAMAQLAEGHPRVVVAQAMMVQAPEVVDHDRLRDDSADL